MRTEESVLIDRIINCFILPHNRNALSHRREKIAGMEFTSLFKIANAIQLRLKKTHSTWELSMRHCLENEPKILFLLLADFYQEMGRRFELCGIDFAGLAVRNYELAERIYCFFKLAESAVFLVMHQIRLLNFSVQKNAARMEMLCAGGMFMLHQKIMLILTSDDERSYFTSKKFLALFSKWDAFNAFAKALKENKASNMSLSALMSKKKDILLGRGLSFYTPEVARAIMTAVDANQSVVNNVRDQCRM